MSQVFSDEQKQRAKDSFVDTEQNIANKLKSGELSGIVLTENFGYVPLRLTGTGLTQRENKEGEIETWDRDLEVFSTPEMMERFKNISVCFSHPTNEEGQLVELGFDNADSIIGNTIDSYIKDGEIWVIARIHNLKALDFMQEYELSTSPHFVSGGIVENGTILEAPSKINHLAIVAKGFWDKYTTNPAIEVGEEVNLIKEDNLAEEVKQEAKADNVLAQDSTSLVDTQTDTIPTEGEKQEEEVQEIKEEVGELKENESQEAEKFQELANQHQNIDQGDVMEEKEVKEEVKEEAKVDETPKEEVIEEKKEEMKVDSEQEEEMKNEIIGDLVTEEAYTEDDDKRNEIIKAMTDLVDSAKAHDIVVKRPAVVGQRLKPSAVLRKFFAINPDLVDSKYKGVVAHIDQDSFELGMDIFNSMKEKVANSISKKRDSVARSGLVTNENGSTSFYIGK